MGVPPPGRDRYPGGPGACWDAPVQRCRRPLPFSPRTGPRKIKIPSNIPERTLGIFGCGRLEGPKAPCRTRPRREKATRAAWKHCGEGGEHFSSCVLRLWGGRIPGRCPKTLIFDPIPDATPPLPYANPLTAPYNKLCSLNDSHRIEEENGLGPVGRRVGSRPRVRSRPARAGCARSTRPGLVGRGESSERDRPGLVGRGESTYP